MANYYKKSHHNDGPFTANIADSKWLTCYYQWLSYKLDKAD